MPLATQHQSYDTLHGKMPTGVPRQTCSELTFSRIWLKHVAQQTVAVAQVGYYVNTKGEEVPIKDALRRAVEGSVHFHSSHVFTPPLTAGPFKTQFIVAYGSSLGCATQLQGEGAHVGVLNSASGKHPGGKFFRGTISQEDTICRASLLYPCLLQFDTRPNPSHLFYYINNKDKYRENASACAVFSPHVPVIRKDDVQATFLDTFETCSFVSIPAPNAFVVGREGNIPKAQEPGAYDAGEIPESITLHEAMHDRIVRALCIFHQQGCTDLVLCAFGCGVHGNHPDSVAKIFRDVLDTDFRGHFRNVVFAIQPSRPANYQAFTDAFPEAAAL